MNELEKRSARVSGAATCAAAGTAAPALMRALNDVAPAAPVYLLQDEPRYRRVGALLGHVIPARDGGLPVLIEPPVTLPPPSSNVVVKWPDERPPLHNTSPQ